MKQNHTQHNTSLIPPYISSHSHTQIIANALQTQVEIAALTEAEPYADMEQVHETCQDILGILPEPITVIAHRTNGSESTGTLPDYLQQELRHYNCLLLHIRQTLAEVSDAIQGRLHMVTRLEQIYAAIADDTVPQEWARQSFPSKKPLASYMRDLQQRIAFFRKWVDVGEPTVYWLSAFYFPQAFLHSKQRRYGRAVNLDAFESIGLRFAVTKCEWVEMESDSSMDDMLKLFQVNKCVVFSESSVIHIFIYRFEMQKCFTFTGSRRSHIDLCKHLHCIPHFACMPASSSPYFSHTFFNSFIFFFSCGEGLVYGGRPMEPQHPVSGRMLTTRAIRCTACDNH